MAGPAFPVNGTPGVDGPAAEHGRRLATTHDAWVGRLFQAGLSLETALGLLGEQHSAAGKVREAISELELGIRDLRDALFASQPDYPDGWPVQAHIRRVPDPTVARED
jgi:hypothetical protein